MTGMVATETLKTRDTHTHRPKPCEADQGKFAVQQLDSADSSLVTKAMISELHSAIFPSVQTASETLNSHGAFGT